MKKWLYLFFVPFIFVACSNDRGYDYLENSLLGIFSKQESDDYITKQLEKAIKLKNKEAFALSLIYLEGNSEEIFDKYLKKSNGYAEYFKALLLKKQNGSENEILELLESAAKQGFNKAYYVMGDIYENKLEFTKAQEYFKKGKDSGDFLSLRSYEAGKNMMNYYKKIETLNKKMSEGNISTDEKKELGTLLVERTQYAGKAYDILKDFLVENYPPALYAKAKVLEGDGKTDEAIKIYQDTLFKNKYYLSAYEIAKKLADENKSYDTALLPLEDVKSDEILINSYMGFLYENLGDFKEAEKYYLKAVAKNDIDTMYYLGKMYETQNELKKAKNMYTKAYSLGSSEAGERLAFLYENEEQSKNTAQSEILKNKEAKKILERLSKNDIDSATVALSSYYPKNSNKVRILNLKAAVDQYPEAYYNLGVYYFNKKKNKKSKFYFIAAKSTGFDIGDFYEAFLKN